jgi:nitrile hydratase
MGGAHGFGPVEVEVDEAPFHADWEKRVLALTLASGAHGRWNLDRSRFVRENVSPAHYLGRSYYEMWLEGLETLLVDSGLLGADDLVAAAEGARFDREAEPPLTVDRVGPVLATGHSARVDADVAPLFAVGDRVRARVASPLGHTREPRYVRGRTGVVERDHGVFVFADTHATTGDPKPQHVYSVCFAAAELWGPDAEGGTVNVDLWDDHLEPAS